MSQHAGAVLLTTAEMARADQAAMDRGISGDSLMEAAGAAVANAVRGRWPMSSTVVLSGPGNNGGDGFVAARHLAEAGWPVTLALLGERGALRGDAARNAERWTRPVVALEPKFLAGAELIVDAIFGAGLTRPVAGAARAAIEAMESSGVPIAAVDMPSGIDGDTGEVRGAAAHADLTVTFFRRKPGHVLQPGRTYCGELVVADIGIPDTVLAGIDPHIFINGPELWQAYYPWPRPDTHKYARGHAIISGGPMTGAARLAAGGALRCGAGLVSIACAPELAAIFAGGRPSIIVRACAGDNAFADLVAQPRVTAILVGPGNGVTEQTKARTLAALGTRKACVLDADALTVFAKKRREMFRAISGPCVMTPHEGEFARLFDNGGDRLSRALSAATASGAHILLKGPNTVVAGPDGRASINEDAPADLATAGTGDVLAGFVLALLAQGMPTFEASSAAVWLHGAAAADFGPGLVAEDLPDRLPVILRRLKSHA